MPPIGLLPALDAAARGGAAALLLLLGVLLLREARRSAAAFYGGLVALCTIAYLVNSWPAISARHPLWLLPLVLISMGIQALLYLWAKAWFDDEFRRSWRDVLPWLALVGLGAGCICADRPVLWYGFQALQLLFIALIIRHALTGRATDLVERRRHFRMVIVLGAAGYSLVIVVLEFTEHTAIFAPPVSAGSAAGLMAFALVLAFTELSLTGRSGFAPLPGPRQAAPAEASEASAQETALLARLRQLMEAEKAYREEGLAIAGLAARLDIPEYRLRRLINQRLGHRNFSSFVNGYRLAEAQAALADPGQAAVPIVTIALDAGFQSLGPFNRAFKAATGMTPTDYRRQELSGGNRPETSPSSKIGEPIPT